MGKKKILIVDDELYIRDLVTNALEEDYIVLEASDGEQAIGIVSKQKPDLILLDPITEAGRSKCVLRYKVWYQYQDDTDYHDERQDRQNRPRLQQRDWCR